MDYFDKFCLGYVLFFLGFFCLLFDPIFYLILFYLTGVGVIYDFSFLVSVSLDLIGYFLHLSPLDILVWSEKEILHYVDVREIYDYLTVLFLFCFGFLGVRVWKFKLKINRLSIDVVKSLKWIVFLPILVLPFFSFFWNNIFHPLFFSNDLWLMDPTDLSFYLFNEWFFILFYLSFILIEFLLFYLLNKKFNSSA